ncbi:MAG: hypothetical protein H7Z76_13460 [Methylotenera sp.]|nr:hypothetical protein [Flavobacterium sp.]
MKSQIFKTAWKIFKSEMITFSNALKKAWEFSKKVTFHLSISWNKKEVPTYTFKGLNFSIATGSLHDTYLRASKHVASSNNGAILDYGCGMYNGD